MFLIHLPNKDFKVMYSHTEPENPEKLTLKLIRNLRLFPKLIQYIFNLLSINQQSLFKIDIHSK
jgi:hypothetical protein